MYNDEQFLSSRHGELQAIQLAKIPAPSLLTGNLSIARSFPIRFTVCRDRTREETGMVGVTWPHGGFTIWGREGGLHHPRLPRQITT